MDIVMWFKEIVPRKVGHAITLITQKNIREELVCIMNNPMDNKFGLKMKKVQQWQDTPNFYAEKNAMQIMNVRLLNSIGVLVHVNIGIRTL